MPLTLQVPTTFLNISEGGAFAYLRDERNMKFL